MESILFGVDMVVESTFIESVSDWLSLPVEHPATLITATNRSEKNVVFIGLLFKCFSL
jgi:hypothetical protein